MPAWMPALPLPELKVLLIAALIALALAVASHWLTRILLRISRAFGYFHELLPRVSAPLDLLLPLLGVQLVWSSAPDDLFLIDGIRRITTLGIIGAFTWLGLRTVDAVERLILVRNPLDISDNLRARRIQTQARVLVRTLSVFVVVFGVASMLMTFPSARRFGTSLLASAGLAGLAVGFAAKPVLGNLIAGLQIALTQPIRVDDVVIVENEWGRIEEITGTYVVVRIWDDRRLIVPLQWFIENPFQNWTRTTASLTGAVTLWVDYSVPLQPLRNEVERLCRETPTLWDGRVSVLQVVDSNERAIQLRVLVSSGDSSRNWDLRCHIRENLIAFLCARYPAALPQLRVDLGDGPASGPAVSRVPAQAQLPERQPPV